MFSRFFIDRPIFANVIAIVTMIVGGVAVVKLPIEQYPQITPPTVQLRASYPGASAQVVADTVAAPIEQAINGVEKMMYMQSSSSSTGDYDLTVTFEVGTNLDTAQIQVQNRLAQAEPMLPEEVRRQGITVNKRSSNLIMSVTLLSPEQKYDSLFLSNYATLRIRDELTRIYGVGDARNFGAAEYSMRIWLDPDQLKARRLTTQDILRTLREQNVQVAAGAVGQAPTPRGQEFTLTVQALGRLSTVEQFREIVVKQGEGTRVTRLEDVAEVELGSQSYDGYTLYNGQPAATLGIFQLPGANAIEVAERVKATVERLSKDFPPGMQYVIPFDTTAFVRESISEVYKTLFEAGVLVLIVILIFLQDWRGVLIPATTVPVTILGAFAAMAAMGYTINLLTLFGLVLAIGTVVDDAIVIVENTARHIENGMPARDATIRAMNEVTGPVIGITLVLMAVFVPALFLGGITGQLYQQFALTIAATALLSALNALTLKPAQAATWLRHHSYKKKFFLFRWFNAVYALVERLYVWIVRGLVRVPALVMAAFLALCGFTYWLYAQLPTSFFPTEDQGYVMAGILLPDGAAMERTRDVVVRASEKLLKIDGVANVYAIGGRSMLDGTSGPNTASLFVRFHPWHERKSPDLSLDAILTRARAVLRDEILEGNISLSPPPMIRGLGTTGGFQLMLQDRGASLAELDDMVQEVVADGSTQSTVRSVSSTFRAGVPQIYADVDRVKAKALNLELTDIFGTMQAFLGSAYVNDFNKYGRTYQVRVQADQDFRRLPEDIARLEVRNRLGQMIPLGSVVQIRKIVGPQSITRYNLYPSAQITGEAAAGRSTGDAIATMESLLAAKLPPTLGYEWTGMSLQEKRTGGEAAWVFGLAVLFVYLVLAAQYECWLLPMAVIFVVPLGLLGASAAVALTGLDNNVYTQIGVVLIIALASKNAILIVEFARELRRNEGRSIRAAAIEAAQLRFRPILMTSFTFILGVVPLVYAHGAGAASRRALGTAVFGGMIASTVLAVFVVPVFFVAFQWLTELRKRKGIASSIASHELAHPNGEEDHNGQPVPESHEPATVG
jgi:HAE1 family hydrophobic/amphiphilic exporter-1